MQENNGPLVSVVIPCRNEEKFIAKCLDSLAAQDYPKNNLEVIVVDGMSKDKTREIFAGYGARFPFLKLLDNPQKVTPCAMNIGIKAAKGEIVIIMGAHANYETDYISASVRSLTENKADNAGGRALVMPGASTKTGRAIAFSLSSSAGSAGAVYRTGKGGKTREVDTVFGGCYKKEIFEKIGYFNEKLIRTQDLELNIRLKKAGGKIIFDPGIKAYYYSKGRLADFFRYNLKCGEWAVYSWRIAERPLKLRQYFPLALMAAFASLFIWKWEAGFVFLGIYLAALALSSLKIAAREKDPGLFLPLVAALISRHFAYGIGSALGILKIILHPRKVDF